VVRIRIPPLRERREDVPLLAQHFLHRHGARMRRGHVRLTEAAAESLMAYAWPGNVRELENVIERALVLSEGDEIGPDLLPTEIRSGTGARDPLAALRGRPLQEALDQLERALLLQALEDNGYVQARAAEQLGLSKSALHYKLQRHRIGAAKS
jgi:DNA-binding NtrC family response regulator